MKKGDNYSMGGRFAFLKSKYLYIGILVFIISIVINILSSWYLLNKYPGKLPVPYDLILNNIPYLNVAFLYDIFGLAAIVLFLVFIFHKKKENEIGYYFLLFGIYYILRGICIVLTPLGNPVAAYNQVFNGGLFDIGAFPSGHVGTCFLGFLLAKGIYKYIIGILTIGVIIALFLSKGHYTIDIIGAIIFSYAVYVFGRDYLRKRFVK